MAEKKPGKQLTDEVQSGMEEKGDNTNQRVSDLSNQEKLRDER